MVTSISAFRFATVRSEGSDSCLVGSSPALSRVVSSARLVAQTDSTVLLQGETGTGKEVIARLVHQESRRASGPFVKLNCAAVPAGLLETELFGHERGAFTGALTQTTGRFQAANKGTLFLDEIGDLPLELQPKLLRVLQEQEFERVGSSRTIRVDIRIIAATNQNLAELVKQHRYRPDLFYRLNVFPIILPPLRDRLEDIPSLVRHFVARFAAQLDKQFDCIPDSVLEVLRRHDWPGNIRELQNVLERAAIVSPGPILHLPFDAIRDLAGAHQPSTMLSLADAESDHILHVLRDVNWVVAGTRGAAHRLGLPRTTLVYKMRKLGISPRRRVTSSQRRMAGWPPPMMKMRSIMLTSHI
jgi:formate hydrogenlyase transcriptional activator